MFNNFPQAFWQPSAAETAETSENYMHSQLSWAGTPPTARPDSTAPSQ